LDKVMRPAQGAIEALGPIGSTILYENDAVRVWAVIVEPGARQPWHRHRLPYLIVPLTGGHIEIEAVDGVIRRPKETVGEVTWREAGEVHELRNVGSSVYRNILVELKSNAIVAPSR
jgi:quercetin dioxygenase-like cupin family protein